MNNVPIQAIPNQAFSIALNGSRFDFNISATNGVMCATIAINGETIISNSRITAGTFMLPYRYEENGNFLMFTMNDEIIYYPNFGTSQTLNWFSPADLAYLRGTNGA